MVRHSTTIAQNRQKMMKPFTMQLKYPDLTLSPNADYDAGTVIINATPAKSGYKAKVTMTPATNIVQ